MAIARGRVTESVPGIGQNIRQGTAAEDESVPSSVVAGKVDAMSRDERTSYFQTLYERGHKHFDAVRFLTEVEAQFKSDTVAHEVRWRLDVLNRIVALPDLEYASRALRDRLTQIFTAGGDEASVLASLRELTEIQLSDGRRLNLRSFLKRDRRVLKEWEYRNVLQHKITNTNAHVVNLIAYYPEAEAELHKLSEGLVELTAKIRDPGVRSVTLRRLEDSVRDLPCFGLYEDLKTRFLKDWLRRFVTLDEEKLKGMTPSEVQHLIQEHQRHQLTQLLKAQIRPVELDMTEHLGLHDTLEGNFEDEKFWSGANVAAKRAFLKWVMDVVLAFGMLKGQRFAFFQNESDESQYLLFGLGLSHLPEASSEPIRMVPYIKPFTRKGTYLLEIRRREIGDAEAYYHELRHYTLPFLFAFDSMKEFEIRNELVSFFTSTY